MLTIEQINQIRAKSGLPPKESNKNSNYVGKYDYLNPEKKESFFGGLGRDIASPFIRGAELVGSAGSLVGSGIKSMAQNALGDKAGAKETAVNALKKAQERTTTKVNVFGREEAPITTNKQAVGAGLEVGSNLIGGGAAKNIFQNGIRTGIKTLAKQGAKAGLASGSMYGAGTALKENGNFGDVLKSSAIGGATGLVGGAVLAPVIGLGEKAVYRLTNTGIKAVKNVTGQINKKIKGVVTADDVERELFNIENNYAKTRKMMDFSKDAGSETRKRLVSADVLSDVTDDAGIIRTKTPGGAKDQYKLKTIDGTEGVVREILVKEGKTVSPDVLEGKMINDIMNSGLEGRALRTALNNVKGEIEGLMLRATPDGQIPLSVIHDAKISTAELAFKNLDPQIKKEGKSIAGSYKRIIEETSDEPIEAINKELQKDYKVLELLDVLDGKRVKGGKLGKYFSQIGGNIVGGAVGSVGGPFGSAAGTIIGGEIAGKIKGQMLKNTFGKSIGSTIERSGIITEASNKVKAPRLLLPAPKPGSPLKSYGSGPTINLPSKTQSTLDNAYSYNLGKRNTMYNTPNTTIKKPIKLKSNNNTSSLTNKKPPVNTPLKSLESELVTKAKESILKEKNPKVQETKNLFVLHNTYDTNLDKILAQGSQPAPSIAIVKKDIPYNDFGNITLVGDKSMIDPAIKHNKVFSGDIYSVRTAKPEYNIKRFSASDSSNFKSLSEDTVNGLRNDSNQGWSKDDFIDRITDKYTDVNKETAIELADTIYGQPFLTVKREVPTGELKTLLNKDRKIREFYKEAKDFEDFQLQVENDYDTIKTLEAIAEKKGIDMYEYTQSLAKDFEEKLPYTNKNIVKKMEQSVQQNNDNIRATEAWAAPSRVHAFKQFSSISDIKKGAKLLTTKEKAETEGEKKINNLLTKADDMGIEVNENGDEVYQIISKYKYSDINLIKNSFKKFNGSKLTTTEASKLGKLLKDTYGNIKSNYFEAKALREVKLQEWKGALVPKGTPPEKINELKKFGLRVVVYNDKKEKANLLKKNFSDLMFGVGSIAIGAKALGESKKQ